MPNHESITNNMTVKIFEIPVLRYSKIDLSIFDFSDFDIKILDIESDEFGEYIRNLYKGFYPGSISFFKDIEEEPHSQKYKRYAIIKNNPLSDFETDKILKVYCTLLLLFPSALQVQYSVHFGDDDGTRWTTKVPYPYGGESKSEDEYLKIDNYSQSKLYNVNKLIKVIYPRFNFENYIGLCYMNYYNSFTASHLHFSYTSLCISLENLVHGKGELTYRIRRIAAIIAGNSKEDCKIIFNNLNIIYDLRSKIVHGDTYKSNDILNKIDYLRGFISRIIIELLVHNVEKNEDLNEIITSLGYGQRNLISTGWEFYELNEINTSKIYNGISDPKVATKNKNTPRKLKNNPLA